MMQPKLKSIVQCTDKEAGEVTRVIIDPLTHDVSHIVVGSPRVNGSERQLPFTETVEAVSEDAVRLRIPSTDLEKFPAFDRSQYITTKEVEIAHLEEHLHVESGEALVPIPQLERDVPRRSFFTNFTHAIGVLIALPMVFPVIKYLMKPMYAPFDNSWVSVGNISKIKEEDKGYQFKFKRKVKEAFMPEEELDRNIWVVKASPQVLEEVYHGEPKKFYDHQGRVVWENPPNIPYVAYSGKCPHLGCGYKWRAVKKLNRELFLCPCHLSFYEASGEVIGGPAPRPLDVLPIQVSSTGQIKIIDVEYKAGTKQQVRVV